MWSSVDANWQMTVQLCAGVYAGCVVMPAAADSTNAVAQGDAVEIVVISKDGTGDKWVPKVDREVLELKKD